jgi:hypothetical protein
LALGTYTKNLCLFFPKNTPWVRHGSPRKRKSDKKWKFAFPDFDGTRGSLMRIDIPIVGALPIWGALMFQPVLEN